MAVPYSLGDAIDWKLKPLDLSDFFFNGPLLARGRDRLETPYLWRLTFDQSIVPYSLGDAIDWKLDVDVVSVFFNHVPYSLGDAIDWKLSQDRSNICLRCLVPYSLGDASEWKPHYAAMRAILYWSPLLARGRDRLETHLISLFNSMIYFGVPYSLGDAIDWKRELSL